MTPEQLNTGQGIFSKIEAYKSHIEKVELLLKPDTGLKLHSSVPVQLNIWRGDYKEELYLKPEHINTNEFLSLYLMRAKQELANLETQFAAL